MFRQAGGSCPPHPLWHRYRMRDFKGLSTAYRYGGNGGRGMYARAALPAVAQDEAGFQAYLHGRFAQQALRAGRQRRARSTAVHPDAHLQPSRGRARSRSSRRARAQRADSQFRALSRPACRRRANQRAAAPPISACVRCWRRIERETGVPESIMVAIWGHETNYGSVIPAISTCRAALPTLAYEGRRREPVRGRVHRDAQDDRSRRAARAAGGQLGRGVRRIRSSCPRSICAWRATGTATGVADIWSSEADTLASIANYFVNAGWRPGQPWGVAVSVPVELQPCRGRATGPTRRAAAACSMSATADGRRWPNGARWASSPQSGRWPDSQYPGDAARTRRPGQDGLSAHRQLSRDPRL